MLLLENSFTPLQFSFIIFYVFSAVGCLLFKMDIRPNHTVYVNNLNEKVKKEGMYVFQ